MFGSKTKNYINISADSIYNVTDDLVCVDRHLLTEEECATLDSYINLLERTTINLRRWFGNRDAKN